MEEVDEIDVEEVDDDIDVDVDVEEVEGKSDDWDKQDDTFHNASSRKAVMFAWLLRRTCMAFFTLCMGDFSTA